jgi:hypothetical protein
LRQKSLRACVAWRLHAHAPGSIFRCSYIIHVKKDKDRSTPHKDKDTHTHGKTKEDVVSFM